MNKLKVAQIVKPQGVRGEVKLKCFTDSPDDFLMLKNIEIDGKDYKILSARVASDCAYLTLLGVNDRNIAEQLRNKDVYSDKFSLPQDKNFVDDIIGLKVILNGKDLGEVSDILQYGAADVFCVKGENNFMFPYVEGIVDKIDLKNCILILNEARFLESVVYED